MTTQEDNTVDKELFRLASLIGCEPEDEDRHRQDLLNYINQKVVEELEALMPKMNTEEYSFWVRDKIAKRLAQLMESEGEND